MLTKLGYRPEWAVNTYTRWRRRSPQAVGNKFESCGWFKEREAWCRQNAERTRLSVYESGDVQLEYGARW